MNFNVPMRVRSISTVLFFLLFFATILRAQPLPERLTFRGQVVDDIGKPVPRAEVMLRRRDRAGVAFWGATISTDEKGAFEFPNIEAGNYFVSVSVGGNLTNRGIVRNRAARADALREVVPQNLAQGVAQNVAPIVNQPLDIAPENATAQFRLVRYGALRIALKDAAGAPVVRTRVAALVKSPNGAGASRVVSALSDDKGVALFPAIAAGRYDIVGAVENVGYIEQNGIDIAPGAPAMTTMWNLKAGGALKIAAKDAAGKALGGVQISLSRLNDEQDLAANARVESQLLHLFTLNATRHGTGTLEVAGLPPGRYNVLAALKDERAVASRGGRQRRTALIAEGAREEIAFELESKNGVALRLKIVDDKGAPCANQNIRLIFQDQSGEGAPYANNRAIRVAIPSRHSALTDAEGFVTLFPIAPGKYRVGAWREETWREDERNGVAGNSIIFPFVNRQMNTAPVVAVAEKIAGETAAPSVLIAR